MAGTMNAGCTHCSGTTHHDPDCVFRSAGRVTFRLDAACAAAAQARSVCAGCQGPCEGTAFQCELETYYANPANGPRPTQATAQNPSPWDAFYHSYGLEYPRTRQYGDDAPPTERVPAAPASRCECGSGSDALSGAHSHWCPRWLAP